MNVLLIELHGVCDVQAQQHCPWLCCDVCAHNVLQQLLLLGS